MKAVTVALLMAGFCSPSFAIDADQVRKCLNLTVDQIDIDASVDLQIVAQAGAITSLEVVGYSPDTEAGYAIARAAYRAAMMCSPYGAKTGTFAITLSAETDPAPGGIPLPGKQ